VHLDLVNLPNLMSLTEGRPEIVVALIDGPVNTSLPEFSSCTVRDISPGVANCGLQESSACRHGTLVAGVLFARRRSMAAICPGCTLLLRPIFGRAKSDHDGVPGSSPEVLAAALIEAVEAGARIVNLSCGVSHCSTQGEIRLREALALAAGKGVIVVAAAGNHGTVGGSCITRDPWVISVASIDRTGRPMETCNLGASIGQRGLAAPGQNVISLNSTGESASFSGTSAACPFVSGAAALLWSEYPHLPAARIKDALTGGRRARSIVPPALDAWGALQRLKAQDNGRTMK
jgi:subtilisin family serine protease